MRVENWGFVSHIVYKDSMYIALYINNLHSLCRSIASSVNAIGNNLLMQSRSCVQFVGMGVQPVYECGMCSILCVPCVVV